MRLLIALPERRRAERVRGCLYAREECWLATVACDGAEALRLLAGERFDLCLLHAHLPGTSGGEILRALAAGPTVCPPRVLFLCDWEARAGLPVADVTVSPWAAPDKLAALLKELAKKPLPALATAGAGRVATAVEAFLNALSMRQDLRGRALIAWLLCRAIPSPLLESQPVSQWYADCGRAFSATPAAVERCVRVAVESVFTQGSIGGIERYFGATVDPEKGKPTNRAFLLQAARQLRQGMEQLGG